ncbi:retrovirus-related Pol polyprotein from transposon TNT 1-94 [Trichonephila clavipes]|nr:retrovirus-related Pol polyprotein from transposon TNT 1-94 [Trichonephila clavipes]
MSIAVGGLESQIEGIGTVKFYIKLNGREHSITLKNVMFSPKLRRNLLSAPLLEKANCTFKCENGMLWFFAPKGEKLFFAKRFNDLYFLKPKYHLKDVYNNVESSNVKEGNKHYSGNIVLWHSRFCHMNIDYLVQISKVSAVNGLPKFKNEELDCESCKLAKTKRGSFKPIGRISTRPLQLVHMDVCGPLPVVSCGGAKYFLSITDDFSRMVTCFPLKKNLKFLNTLNLFKRMLKEF